MNPTISTKLVNDILPSNRLLTHKQQDWLARCVDFSSQREIIAVNAVEDDYRTINVVVYDKKLSEFYGRQVTARCSVSLEGNIEHFILSDNQSKLLTVTMERRYKEINSAQISEFKSDGFDVVECINVWDGRQKPSLALRYEVNYKEPTVYKPTLANSIDAKRGLAFIETVWGDNNGIGFNNYAGMQLTINAEITLRKTLADIVERLPVQPSV